jgi:hypothetical protein
MSSLVADVWFGNKTLGIFVGSILEFIDLSVIVYLKIKG